MLPVMEVVEEQHCRTDRPVEKIIFYHCKKGLKFDTDPVRGFAYSRLISVPVESHTQVNLQLFVEMVLEDVPLCGRVVT